jgi:hypothetical protein
MNRLPRLLAGCAVAVGVLGAGLLAPSPAEAHWRPYWRPGIFHPGFYPRPAFYPRPFFYPPPIIYPRSVVFAPVYAPPPPPPPPVYAAYQPPPVAYTRPYRKRVVHRHYRKTSKRAGCICPAQPAAAPAPQQVPAPEQASGQGLLIAPWVRPPSGAPIRHSNCRARGLRSASRCRCC